MGIFRIEKKNMKIKNCFYVFQLEKTKLIFDFLQKIRTYCHNRRLLAEYNFNLKNLILLHAP